MGQDLVPRHFLSGYLERRLVFFSSLEDGAFLMELHCINQGDIQAWLLRVLKFDDVLEH